MRAIAKYVWIRLLLLSLCMPAAFAQTGAPQEQAYSQAELDQMLAPIALYPDPLLSQILIAATYPLEVVEAARWSRARPGLRGDAAVRAAENQNWDPSVKSLVAFPQILSIMDSRLEWTERLGDAFLAQQEQVMAAVQSLRRRAYEEGNLQSNDQVRVEDDYDDIAIEPSNPDVVYVPYYNSTVIYGSWWWPGYPPVYWAPWPGYHTHTGFVGITWGIGVGVGVNFFFSTWDWSHHHVRISDRHPFYIRHVDRRLLPPDRIWRHDPVHRRGVPYRSPAVREHFRRRVGSPEQRREFRGFVPRVPEAQPRVPEHVPPRRQEQPRIVPGNRAPARAAPDHRPRPPQEPQRTAPRRDIETWHPNTPVIRRLPTHPVTPAPTIRRAPAPRPHVFEGIGRGQDTRRYSDRGRRSTGAPPPVTNRAPARQAPPAVNRGPARGTRDQVSPPERSQDSNRWYRGQGQR